MVGYGLRSYQQCRFIHIATESSNELPSDQQRLRSAPALVIARIEREVDLRRLNERRGYPPVDQSHEPDGEKKPGHRLTMGIAARPGEISHHGHRWNQDGC